MRRCRARQDLVGRPAAAPATRRRRRVRIRREADGIPGRAALVADLGAQRVGGRGHPAQALDRLPARDPEHGAAAAVDAGIAAFVAGDLVRDELEEEPAPGATSGRTVS